MPGTEPTCLPAPEIESVEPDCDPTEHWMVDATSTLSLEVTTTGSPEVIVTVSPPRGDRIRANMSQGSWRGREGVRSARLLWQWPGRGSKRRTGPAGSRPAG